LQYAGLNSGSLGMPEALERARWVGPKLVFLDIDVYAYTKLVKEPNKALVEGEELYLTFY
jgi:hypothetical protein